MMASGANTKAIRKTASKANTKTVSISTVADANGWVIVEEDVVAISATLKGHGRPKAQPVCFESLPRKYPLNFWATWKRQ